MKTKGLLRAVIVAMLLPSLAAWGDDLQKDRLDRLYRSATTDFEAHRYARAIEQLEMLLPYAPDSFAVHEMLGLAYGGVAKDAKAKEHLTKAVELMPESAEARTNLGACLVRAGKLDLAGEQFRKALALEPRNYDANHNLGEYYIRLGKMAEARPLLAEAQKIDPGAYDNGYDLCLADFLLGRIAEARVEAEALLKVRDTGELHNLLGQIYEKAGDYLAAAKNYETAAHLDPSEDNLFDWGSEMLLHRTYEAAIAVYGEGVHRYPDSARLRIGLGLALYSRGKYDDAVKSLLSAAELDPSDARCYLFLAKAYNSSPLQADAVTSAFRHYAELQPGNALAQYYYAMSLWKGKRMGDSSLDLHTIEAILQRSIALDDSIAEAHLQLGNLYADQHFYDKSLPQYLRALELDPDLADAHYRLGTDYVHLGQKENAQRHFAIYQKLRAEHLAEVEKERAEVRQFVLSEKTSASPQQ